MSKTFLPSDVRPVILMPAAADAAGRSSAFVSLKNFGRCYLLASIAQGAANTVLLSVLQATAVDGTGSKVATQTQPIWVNQDTGAGDLWVRQTEALNFTTSATLASKMVLFQVDPTYLDVANGFDCVGLSTGASAAGNLTSVIALLTDARFADLTSSARVN